MVGPEGGEGRVTSIQPDLVLVLPYGDLPFVWLRDNCPCPGCRHPDLRQKLAPDVPPPGVHPRSVQIDDDAVCIDWDEEPGHRSRYSHEWLRAHLDHDAPPSPKLWNATSLSMTRLELHGSPPTTVALDDALDTTGIALVHGLAEEAFQDWVRSLGPLYHTEYGEFAPVSVSADPQDPSACADELLPHTDYSTYMSAPELAQFLYCTTNDADCCSLFVDGFAVADQLGVEDPAALDLLATVPIQFEQTYARWRYDFRGDARVVERDLDGRIRAIRFGHAHAWAWEIPRDLVVPYYDAYRTFLDLVRSPSNQLRLTLAPGDCIVIDNRRVLHGRARFDPLRPRRLLIGYLNRSFVAARARFERAMP